MLKTKMKKAATAVLAASMAATLIPQLGGIVLADGVKNQDNTCLGTSGISSPLIPSTESSVWSGSYVYFGTYKDEPIKFRVLAPNTSAYGSPSLFLDSDSVLFSGKFSSVSNLWADSDIRTRLNGEFKENSFTSVERYAIMKSVSDSIQLTGDKLPDFYGCSVALDDYIFLLDASEVINEKYGYSSKTGHALNPDGDWYVYEVYNRRKEGATTKWLLRNYNPNQPYEVGLVTYKGFLECTSYGYMFDGVAPALNIGQSSILFSTAVGGNLGENGTEYKLTIIDSDMKIAVPSGKEVSADGSKITFPYEITGDNAANATRISALILDKEYTPGNTNGASVLFYDEVDGTPGSEGTFMLPDTLDIADWGTGYHVYIVAEDINGEKETDYASAPLEISNPLSGEETKDGWVLDDGKYYFYVNGEMKTGWLNDSGNWYYLEPGTGVMATGWKKIGGNWYFFRSAGSMVTGWYEDNGKYYYFKPNGTMASGEYCDGYWLGSDGAWTYTAKASWKHNSTGWYYIDTLGWYPKNQWLKIDGQWYYFKADGYMASGEYCNGYWLNTNGTWTYTAKASWMKNSTGWYYMDTLGWYAKDCTIKIDGKFYIFNASGYCTNP